MVAILAVIIATPIALRASFFINFRADKSKRVLSIFINILAGVPSILFGIFAYFSLSKFTGIFINGNAANTLLNGSFMLAIMILPTMISLINNTITSVPKEMFDSALALGNSKTSVIYSVVKKKIQPGVSVAIISGLGRAIGETMALSIILPTTGTDYFDGGLLHLFKMPLMTLGIYIAKFYFTDGGVNTEYLFAAGIALFVVIMILILIVNHITKNKTMNYLNPIERFKKIFDDNESRNTKFYLNLIFLLIIFPFIMIG